LNVPTRRHSLPESLVNHHEKPMSNQIDIKKHQLGRKASNSTLPSSSGGRKNLPYALVPAQRSRKSQHKTHSPEDEKVEQSPTIRRCSSSSINPSESETKLSDCFPSDVEASPTKEADSALSVALISTIQQLSVRAALALSRP
jgi:hypothetical protein